MKDDLISRQAVIDLVEELETQRLKGDIGLLYAPMIKGLKKLPSVQETHDKRTETHACDLISRQAAISFVDCGYLRPPTELAWSDKDVVDMLKRVPSVQPTQNNTSNTSNALKSLDCVDRQAAIDALGEKPLVWDDLSDFDLGKAAQWSDDVDAIKELPSAQPTQNTTHNALKSLDCIDRQAAIEVADAVWSVTGDKNVAKVWDQLKDLPSAQLQRWIPVTERLPEEDGQYLITVKYKHVDGYDDIYAEHGDWYNGKWDMVCFGHCGEVEGITAWMPLPEPYKEGE